jgi:hypothetical protein
MPVQPLHSTSRLGASMEITPMIGVGAGDFQLAVAAEVKRILKETKGDVLAQHELLTGMLHERGLITDKEVEVVSRLAEVGHDAGAGKKSGKEGMKSAKEGYFESRDLYNRLLASGEASPLALVIASSAVGSYEITEDPDGSGGVIFAKTSGEWEGRGTKIGGLVGAYFGGVGGAALGGLIGGSVGKAVDECLD